MGTPTAMAKRIEKTPACIEMRAPHTTREKPSRPRSSVPKGCAALGAFRSLPQSVRVGSLVAIQGAPTAITTKSATTKAPAIAAGRRRPTRHARHSRPLRAAGAVVSSGSAYAVASGAIGGTADADPRVEHRVGHVDEEV